MSLDLSISMSLLFITVLALVSDIKDGVLEESTQVICLLLASVGLVIMTLNAFPEDSSVTVKKTDKEKLRIENEDVVKKYEMMEDLK